MLLVVSLAGTPADAQQTPPDARAMAAAERIRAEAQADAGRDCSAPAEILVRVLCSGRLHVGLRSYYPGFSVRGEDGTYSGFEYDIARAIADFLGVRLAPVAVDARDRIALLAANEIDIVIATLGHNTQRDAEVTFIQPHYYRSRTVVVGARHDHVAGWQDLSGHTVCLPLGAGSNILFIRHHIPVLTFDMPEQLIDALAFGECGYIVHDDSFFGSLLADPQWSAKYGVDFGFAPIPWGMAVARDDTLKLSALLTALSIALHANGTFLELARAHGLKLDFLQQEQRHWSSSTCVTANGGPVLSCLTAPTETSDDDSTDAAIPHAEWFGQTLAGWAGARLGLALLGDHNTFSLLLQGIGFSLALVLGSLLATMAFAVAFGFLLGNGPRALRRLWGTLATIGQTTPLPLLLFFGYVVAGGTLEYTGGIALAVSILIIGFYNGCNGGRAIDEARQTLRRRQHNGSPRSSLWRAMMLADIQLIAFLINAAKSSPAAGMIGVPEFLNVLTDLMSYSRDRLAVYLILLVFYTGLVLLVIVFLYGARERLGARVHPAS